MRRATFPSAFSPGVTAPTRHETFRLHRQQPGMDGGHGRHGHTGAAWSISAGFRCFVHCGFRVSHSDGAVVPRRHRSAEGIWRRLFAGNSRPVFVYKLSGRKRRLPLRLGGLHPEIRGEPISFGTRQPGPGRNRTYRTSDGMGKYQPQELRGCLPAGVSVTLQMPGRFQT